MATTLDHISGGRAVLGIGAAWFETEHRAFGLPFGERPAGAAALARRGAAGHARHARRRARRRPPAQRYHADGGAQRPAADPAPAAAPRRRRRRAGDAQARGPVRGREQPRRRLRERAAQGRDPAPALRGGRARRARDRADGRPRRRSSSATRATRRARVYDGDRRGERPRARSGRTSRSARRRTWSRCSRRTPTIGYRHLIAGFPSPYDEESMTRLIPRCQPEARRWLSGRARRSPGVPGRIDLFWVDAARRALASRLRPRRLGRRPSRSAGRSTGGIAVTAWAVDRMEVFAVFPDGELWDRYWDGAAWHAWESLGGELRGRSRRRRRGARTGSTSSPRAATAGPGTAGGTARAGCPGRPCPRNSDGIVSRRQPVIGRSSSACPRSGRGSRARCTSCHRRSPRRVRPDDQGRLASVRPEGPVTGEEEAAAASVDVTACRGAAAWVWAERTRRRGTR